MNAIISLVIDTLSSPVILFFVLGFAAALARSDLSIPNAIAKGLSIYLLFAIGFKGGVSVAENGPNTTILLSISAGIVLSFLMPFIGFMLLRVMSQLSTIDAAAVAAHYGSISIVTFVTATSVLNSAGLTSDGFMVAVAAAMEAPAILSALWLVARFDAESVDQLNAEVIREMLLNGSIVLLVGSFVIGIITGKEGMESISAFVVAPFQGILCLFLLDMGLIAGSGLRDSRSDLSWRILGFGILMPVIGSSLGLMAAMLIGLSLGSSVLLMTLAASASYIAVPAAMRVALPQANPSIYLTLSLGITFPFNLVLGIPLYLLMAQWIHAIL